MRPGPVFGVLRAYELLEALGHGSFGRYWHGIVTYDYTCIRYLHGQGGRCTWFLSLISTVKQHLTWQLAPTLSPPLLRGTLVVQKYVGPFVSLNPLSHEKQASF